VWSWAIRLGPRAGLERLAELHRLCAEGKRALLLVLQGLDASGKDGTIKHVMSGVNPQAVSVTPFSSRRGSGTSRGPARGS
jgi:polyphosphate kinase 2 (PPK2 family)